jgi:hypothetical protein
MERFESEEGFNQLAWHDNAIYGLRLDVGDSDRGEWRSDLVLDIDHIVEWICGVGGGVRFRVAPTTLTFHDVTDLSVTVDFGDSGYRTAISELAIDHIGREPVPDQQIGLDRPYFRFRIVLNLPPGGALTFGASGFS